MRSINLAYVSFRAHVNSAHRIVSHFDSIRNLPGRQAADVRLLVGGV